MMCVSVHRGMERNKPFSPGIMPCYIIRHKTIQPQLMTKTGSSEASTNNNHKAFFKVYINNEECVVVMDTSDV